MEELSRRFESALQLAIQLHREEVREGKDVPLVAHLLGACSIALEHNASEDEAIAALLHHAPDRLGPKSGPEELRRRFGEKVARIVYECRCAVSDEDVPWNEQKEAFIATIPAMSDSARFVSLAEKLDDAQAVLREYQEHGESIWGRFKGGREGVLWYYRELVGAFGGTSATSLAMGFDAVVDELEQQTVGD